MISSYQPTIFAVSRREYYGHNYDEFLTLQAYYRIAKTGKNAKKSSVVSREIVERSLKDPTFCGVVLRKIFKDHHGTTYAAIMKAFNWIKARTGYDYTKEWTSAMGSQNPRIENTRTGQVIRFASFDRPNSVAGFELENEWLYYGELWFEEPMQVSDMRNQASNMTQEHEQHQFEIIESSVFRGNLPHKGAYRSLSITTNDWSDGNHWILKKFVYPFVREDYRILDIYGKQVYYDPDFQNGKGIIVQVTSAGVNEFMDDQYKDYLKHIRVTDYEFYKAIGLGTRTTLVGNAYGAGNTQKIRRDIDLSLVEQFVIGWDYASSKDETAISLTGINRQTFDMQLIDGWSYHRGQAKNPVSEPELIKVMMAVICEWQKKYHFNNFEWKTTIRGDSKDTMIIALLQQEWANLPGHQRIDLDEPQPAPKFNSASSFIRIMVTRWLMGAGKLRISPHLDDWYDAFKAREILVDGQVKDGKDDKSQSFEYGWSWDIESIIPYQHYQILIDQQDQKRWERWNNEHQINTPRV